MAIRHLLQGGQPPPPLVGQQLDGGDDSESATTAALHTPSPGPVGVLPFRILSSRLDLSIFVIGIYCVNHFVGVCHVMKRWLGTDTFQGMVGYLFPMTAGHLVVCLLRGFGFCTFICEFYIRSLLALLGRCGRSART